MNSAGVYVHIPFCAHKCFYCDFYSQIRSQSIREEYVNALIHQIRHTSFEPPIQTVYLGGGTPSLLRPQQIDRILTALTNGANLDSDAEITMEINPETVTLQDLYDLQNSGVNRFSMGVQTLDDALLKTLGRTARAQDCRRAVENLRRAGADNISLDLMLAIPGQTPDSLHQTLSEMLDWKPEHISAYLLKVEPGSVFGRTGVREADEDTQSDFYLQTCRRLCQSGYEHYEVSNFAQPGFRSRHNQIYWNGGVYFALGCGASGFDGTHRFKIPADTTAYIRANGLLEPVIEQTLTAQDRDAEYWMLRLRTSDGVDQNRANDRQRLFLEQLVKQKLAVRTSNGWALTARGFLVSNEIILQLLDRM